MKWDIWLLSQHTISPFAPKKRNKMCSVSFDEWIVLKRVPWLREGSARRNIRIHNCLLCQLSINHKILFFSHFVLLFISQFDNKTNSTTEWNNKEFGEKSKSAKQHRMKKWEQPVCAVSSDTLCWTRSRPFVSFLRFFLRLQIAILVFHSIVVGAFRGEIFVFGKSAIFPCVHSFAQWKIERRRQRRRSKAIHCPTKSSTFQCVLVYSPRSFTFRSLSLSVERRERRAQHSVV